MDYLPFRRTKRGIALLYTTLINVDLAQYEISRAKVCDFWQRWTEDTYEEVVEFRAVL